MKPYQNSNKKHIKYDKRGKTRATKMRSVLVQLSLVEVVAWFLKENILKREEKQIQADVNNFDTHLKTTIL